MTIFQGIQACKHGQSSHSIHRTYGCLADLMRLTEGPLWSIFYVESKRILRYHCKKHVLAKGEIISHLNISITVNKDSYR